MLADALPPAENTLSHCWHIGSSFKSSQTLIALHCVTYLRPQDVRAAGTLLFCSNPSVYKTQIFAWYGLRMNTHTAQYYLTAFSN